MTDSIFISPLSRNSIGGMYHSNRTAALASATYTTTAALAPFSLGAPYTLQRWFWQNGATVGTDYMSVGIYDDNAILRYASPRTLTAGSSVGQFVAPGNYAANVLKLSDSTDSATYTTASCTLKAGMLYLLSVENSAASADAITSVTSATSGYPTFTSRSTTQFNTTANRVSIWSCVPATDFTGALIITFPGAQTGACWSLDAFYNVDTTTTDGIVQQAAGTGNDTTPTATLAAFGSVNNATYGAFGQATTGNGAPESAAYVELCDVTAATPAQSLQTDYNLANDTSVTETITSGQWGACAVEIKCLASAAIALPIMRGFIGYHSSGSTATFLKLSGTDSTRTMLRTTGAATTALPYAPAFVAASSTNYHLVLAGFTNRATP
jgi:hypothetical protein